MQQDVRNSVAVLFETAMENHSKELVLSTLEAIRIVLSSSGHTPKEVGDWLRKEARSGDEGARKPETKKNWAPSPVAPLPSGMNEEEACEKAERNVLRAMSAPKGMISASEREFLDSLLLRLSEKKRWMTHKQLRWYEELMRRCGIAT